MTTQQVDPLQQLMDDSAELDDVPITQLPENQPNSENSAAREAPPREDATETETPPTPVAEESTPAPEPTSESEPPSPYELPPEAAYQPQQPQGPLSDPEREQLAYYRQRERDYQVSDQQRALDQYHQQAFNYYVNQGYDEQTAQLVADARREERGIALEDRRQILQEQQVRDAQQRATQDVGNRFGVNPSALQGFQRVEDMERHASLLKAYGDRDREYQQRFKSLEENRVSEQTYDGGGPSSGGPTGIDELEARIGNPDYRATAAEMQQLRDLQQKARGG